MIVDTYDIKSNIALLRKVSIFGLLMSAAFASPVLANDTTAVIAAGGLQFTKTDELQMESEDLFLSREGIRVKYRFRNLTDHDVNVTVAFPMPKLDIRGLYVGNHDFHPSGREGDIFDFHARVNGKDIQATLDAHAFDTNGVEVTDKLHRLGMPITDLDKDHDLFDISNKLYNESDKRLWSEELFLGDYPNWDVVASYYWQQNFPAHTTTTIEHFYKPSVGREYFDWTDDMKNHFIQSDRAKSTWCPDEDLISAVKKISRELGHEEGAARELQYILKTGANWAGPIGHFRLQIDKGKASLISTCPIPGLTLKKQGNSFVAEADNFTPTTDIDILLLYRKSTGE